ncbi:Uma2 family endonuclease [Streptomyces corynorhini]|uniref:Uma2 family endonuclease n=1 Tax=Streptomyces corynorhini TaxID=2282652 RepID=A0A370BEB1_9ACTN|nr:Uma2 family endonuclease [Streptomyces corynorhini]RDG38056.1 Uma2 family endonuclease [Streptomyces corynorhini]
MTAVDERPITSSIATFFEDLEVPEGYKAELLRGDIVMMAGPDRVHNGIVESVQDQIPRKRWRRLQTQDIAIPGETSEPQPDLVVLARGAEDGPGRLIPAPAVTLLVEVVSKTSVDRDYGIKRSMYAAGGVPAYLIIDPMAALCLLLTEPARKGEAADYRTTRTTKFGETATLEMLGVELDTSDFETLPDIRRHYRP